MSNWPRIVGQVILGWAGVTAAWAVMLALLFFKLNELKALDLAFLFGFWWAIYLLLTIPGAFVAACIVPALKLRSGRKAVWISAAAVGGMIAASVVISRWAAAYQALAGFRFTPMSIADCIVVIACWLLGVFGVARLTCGKRRDALASLSLLIVLLLGTHIANVRYERPTRVNLEEAVAPYITADDTCHPRSTPVKGITILALDGMTWNVAAPLLQQGRMPNFAALLGRGVYGHLDPVFPSYSPVVWATIATGLPESEHGIHGFLRFWIPGVSGPIVEGLNVNSLTWVGATEYILYIATEIGLVHCDPQPIDQRSGLALWDIAGANGYRVGVYDYMNTWPVPSVNGYMYSHVGPPPSNMWPPELSDVLANVEIPAERSPWLKNYAKQYAEAFGLAQAFEPSVSMNFNKVMDNLHERWWPSGILFRVPQRPPYTRYPPIVEKAYELTDVWIGRFMDAFPDHVLILVSDHGFEFNGTLHVCLPPGVIVLAGGPFGCGQRLEGADTFDVLPTVLALLGLPGLSQMPGKVLEDAFAVEPPPLERLPAYPSEWRSSSREQAMEGEDWHELRDRLRALGYVR